MTSAYEVENNLPHHPALQRVTKSLTAIESSVLECAIAGCSSVWVCCDETMQPLIKNRLGDYVRDPVNLNKSNYTNFPEDNRIMVPIYYYQVHPKDKAKRIGLAWDFINTVLAIYHFSNKLSRWLVPEKYYISFCYGLYGLETIRSSRQLFLGSDNYILTNSGEDLFDGLYLGACLKSDYIRETVISLKKGNLYFNSPGMRFTDLPRPPDHKKIEVSEYFSCNSWDSYVEYIKNKSFLNDYSRDIFFNLKSSGVKI